MSNLEDEFLFQLLTFGVEDPEREYRFAPPRRWRFDFAWPSRLLACEVEGGTWMNGAHSRGKKYESDCEKYNSAQLGGWVVLRFTTDMVSDLRALNTIKKAFGEDPVTGSHV